MKYSKRNSTEALKVIRYKLPDSEAVFKKATEIMIHKAGRCVCDVPIDSYYIRIPGEYKLRCLRCRLVISPLSVTPFRKQHNELIDTVDLACRFICIGKPLPVSEIARVYGYTRKTARLHFHRVIKWLEIALDESGKYTPNKHTNNIKVIKAFSDRHENLTAAIDGLFDSLPSLKVAMRPNSQNQ